jgi:hypothetical protein
MTMIRLGDQNSSWCGMAQVAQETAAADIDRLLDELDREPRHAVSLAESWHQIESSRPN